MKTEKQIRAKIKQVIKNNNDLVKRLKEPPAIIVVYEYNLGMLDILEWVLEDEEGQR